MTAIVNAKNQQSDSRIPYKACPLCDSTQMETVMTADCSKHPLYNPVIPPLMAWKKCDLCAHVFTDGYFTDAATSVIFSKTNEHQKAGYDMERQRPVSARMVEKILPYFQSGHWLDVGYGNASLLFTAQEYGFTPVGIDLREDNVERLRAFDIEAHCVHLDKLNQPGRYSVISMADVLEHVPFPRECLKSVHALLGRDGLLFLSMPNSDSMLWNALGQNNLNPYWGELEHYHNFGRERLYDLLRECGFEPVRFGVSERYRVCMEVLARKAGG